MTIELANAMSDSKKASEIWLQVTMTKTTARRALENKLSFGPSSLNKLAHLSAGPNTVLEGSVHG